MNAVVSHSESPQPFNQQLKRLLNRIKSPAFGIALVALLAVVVACCIVMALWLVSVPYRPLYGAQENFDSAKVIELLEAEGQSYQVSPQNGAILVPEDQLGEIRMLMAARGILARLPSGFDSVNSDMTTSQFMEQAHYRQGLEGELAQTIMGLEQIRSARVHLAVPKAQVFMRREDPKPSASIMVELAVGAHLNRSEITGIINLVAGSVTGLEVENVRLVDQQGQLLSGQSRTKGLGISEQHTEFQQHLEQTLVERASTMLEPLLGYGNFRVQISAKMNFDKVEETRESLDPNAVLKQEASNTLSINTPDPVGVPGGLSNLPAELQFGQQVLPQSRMESKNDSKQDEQINRQFEVGRAITRTQKQQGQITHLSISVLLNDAVTKELGWSQSQLDSVSAMVQDAVGYETQRSDRFSLAVLPFQAAKPAQVHAQPWWQQPGNQFYLRAAVGLMLMLMMLLFVVRPLIRTITRSYEGQRSQRLNDPIQVLGMPEPLATSNETTPEPGRELVVPESVPSGKPINPAAVSIPGLTLVPASDASLDTQLHHLGQLAGQAPDKVAEVIELMLAGGEKEHE